MSRSLFRVKLPVVRNQLGCAPAAPPHRRRTARPRRSAAGHATAWVTSHVSYRGVRGGVAQCGGPGRTDHSSPKEIAARVMGPCLAHRVVDAAASEQDDVASVESCSSRLLAPSVLPETRSWAARQPHWRPQWAEAADGRTTRARKCTEVRAPPCTVYGARGCDPERDVFREGKKKGGVRRRWACRHLVPLRRSHCAHRRENPAQKLEATTEKSSWKCRPSGHRAASDGWMFDGLISSA